MNAWKLSLVAVGLVCITAISVAAVQGKEPPTRTNAGPGPQVPRVIPNRCPDARVGLAFYRGTYAGWRARRFADTPYPAGRKPVNCADAHYLAELWEHRSYQERLFTRRWLSIHLIRDFPFGPGNHAWHKAVRETQKVFPGTEAWLLSCSGAEGGHGRWVTYGGGSYYPGFEHRYVVGGPMQFKWPTFKGMFRRALEYLSERDYIVPARLRDPGNVRAWLSATAQALAAGWARYTGNDDSHWQASWGDGC